MENRLKTYCVGCPYCYSEETKHPMALNDVEDTLSIATCVGCGKDFLVSAVLTPELTCMKFEYPELRSINP